MIVAISAVCEDKKSIAQAAIEHTVPRRTLDRIKNKVVHSTRPGLSTVLIKVEEDVLMSYFIYMGECGLPLTCTLSKVLPWVVAVRSGKHVSFSQGGPKEHW